MYPFCPHDKKYLRVPVAFLWALTLGPDCTHSVPVGPKTYLEIKIRLEDDESGREIKEAFERAAEQSRPTLSANQWLITAGLEKLKRDGIPVGKKGRAR